MSEESNVNTDMPAKYEDRQIYDIPVEDILEDTDQPRKYFDKEAQDALKKSIKEYGLMQPIVFRQREKDGRLMVVAGERRVRAIKSILRKAKTNPDDPEQQRLVQRFSTIPGMFVAKNHQEISLIENVQRENLNPVELAEGLAKIKKVGTYGLELLGTMIGKATSSVSEILSINKLSDEIRDEARKRNDISQWVLVAVAKAKGSEAQAKRWEKLKDSRITQSAYKKKRKQKLAQVQEQRFNFGSSMRAVKTASTQLQKLKGPEIASIPVDERQKLRTELEALRDELEQVLSGF
ncbi:MAG: ParB N-terminal domain-containing protein [Desulfovibrionaceae bacterium]|nr:ParB N-terminal domain-containing protein [Desulfovibrionaceae bacterium]